MAMVITMFDTHAAVEDLISKGIKKEQAEAFVRVVRESKDSELDRLASKEQMAMLEREVALLASKEQVMMLEKDFEHMKQSVATKADLAELKIELKTEIVEVRTELKTEIAELKTEIANVKATLLKWYIATTIVIIGLLLSLKLVG